MVLPSLKPLFTIKEPPQNMLTLLDNLTMLQNKTDKLVFRERQSGYYLVIQLIIMISIRCSPSCLQCSRVRTRDGDHLPHIQSMFPNWSGRPGSRACFKSCSRFVWHYRLCRGPGSSIPSRGCTFQSLKVVAFCWYTLDMKLVFTKTRILTVKVATLVTFLSMVKTLDQVGWLFGLFCGR